MKPETYNASTIELEEKNVKPFYVLDEEMTTGILFFERINEILHYSDDINAVKRILARFIQIQIKGKDFVKNEYFPEKKDLENAEDLIVISGMSQTVKAYKEGN